MRKILWAATVLLLILAVLFAIRLVREARRSRTMTPTLGVADGRLQPCPTRPNCVSSDATGEHAIAALADGSAAAWAELERIIRAMEGATVVSRTDGYLHATYSTPRFGFVDDLELHRRDGEVAVRSASRVGYSDLGANRRRVEAIRARLGG